MPSRTPIRLLPVLFLGLSLLCAAAHAQSPNGIPPGRQFGEGLILPTPQPPRPPAARPSPSLPPTPPTIQPPAIQPPSPPVAAPATTQPAYISPKTPALRARVTFTAGLLSIAADNSSLNQILRDVSRQTGLAISGGVNEDRVYGTYGPADTGSVLSALLLGSGTNFLLVEPNPGTPHQLILTPRQGGASPPTPVQMQPTDDDDADLPPTQQIPPRLTPAPVPPSPVSVESSLPPPPASAPATTTAATTTAATPDESPNGVKTPQQIYDQLMKLQAQKLAVKPQQ